MGEAASGDGCRIVPPFDGGELVASAAAALVQAGGTVGGAATKWGDARAARTSSRSRRLKTSGSSTHSTSYASSQTWSTMAGHHSPSQRASTRAPTAKRCAVLNGSSTAGGGGGGDFFAGGFFF